MADSARPTVGESRRFLARYGIPHDDGTHYVIVASWPSDLSSPLAVINCCDDPGDSVTLLRAALYGLTGDAPVIPDSGNVIVSREDLRHVLRYARGPGYEPTPAIERLAAAAGAA